MKFTGKQMMAFGQTAIAALLAITRREIPIQLSNSSPPSSSGLTGRSRIPETPVLVGRALSHPPHPTATFVTIASRFSFGRDGAN
jgi:hypothetical protein